MLEPGKLALVQKPGFEHDGSVCAILGLYEADGVQLVDVVVYDQTEVSTLQVTDLNDGIMRKVPLGRYPNLAVQYNLLRGPYVKKQPPLFEIVPMADEEFKELVKELEDVPTLAPPHYKHIDEELMDELRDLVEAVTEEEDEPKTRQAAPKAKAKKAKSKGKSRSRKKPKAEV